MSMNSPSAKERWSWTPIWQFIVVIGVITLFAPYVAREVRYAFLSAELRFESEQAAIRLARLDDTTSAFREVAKLSRPSVVEILASHSTQNQLEDIVTSSGRGSGIIIDSGGFVLTNYHVIKGHNQFQVRLSDHPDPVLAMLYRTDRARDLAILKIRGHGLKAVRWGDSDHLEVGDWVVAIGSPFGLNQSLSVGVVSAKKRTGVNPDNPGQIFLQTDARINLGNSGGPLFNLHGEIVGINTAIIGESFQGISFAIPSHEIQQFIGGIEQPSWLGAHLRERNPGFAEERSFTDLHSFSKGILITELVPNAPAEKAGLQAGDLLLQWDEEEITSLDELKSWIAGTSPDRVIPVTIFRDGIELVIPVQLERMQ
ncbi:Protease do [Planctomycetales bacterium 10988]|nr:Protease do [Planctomycetales bacterium 10988]